MPEEAKIPEQSDRRRTNKQLREMVDNFLDHLRYVVRQDRTEFRENELMLAKERYDRLWDELWRLMIQDEHPTSCTCGVCTRLRVEDDR